jgi:replicative DNA helicase
MSWIAGQISGNTAHEKVVVTGMPRFDDSAGAIGMHEYVIVGARTSTGKSSFMTQLAAHNLYRGLRVAYFTLETSAKAVLLQMGAQRAGVNLRRLSMEFTNKQDALKKEIEKLRNMPLLVYERDLSLEQIEARCRLLASTWKPDLVIIDYLGLIRVNADGAYERMTKLSKSMIPLKKALGCTLIVAAQLNRGNEREDRPPSRTDFRDTGSIEEDAHRVLALHRPSKDDSGQLQGYDRSEYLQELYQLKNRDGSLAQTRLTFFAPHTKFAERT